MRLELATEVLCASAPALFAVGTITSVFAGRTLDGRRLHRYGKATEAEVVSSHLADAMHHGNDRVARVRYRTEAGQDVEAEVSFEDRLLPAEPGDVLPVRYEPVRPLVVRVDLPRYSGRPAIRRATIGLAISGTVTALILAFVLLALIDVLIGDTTPAR
ncbi:DUF3592 domain-containing protein [Solwaraspora sp. WMMD1047]|uniref:DUF3592 domain-containing protein n=1 Tax=Solwaraspora sp. WMMD1047 TaxID=3016102 RepID=UPI00241676C7|nr:DUF3592 domain-containing protein [Solwaraspora sp. WMMD1047]MDG4829002.1 DUF3592 domain-containing protein [Solwaraspora sp. WMMD1047]